MSGEKTQADVPFTTCAQCGGRVRRGDKGWESVFESTVAQLRERLRTAGEALKRCEALIAEELEPHESEPSGVSAGVDWVREVLLEARAALVEARKENQ